ARQTGVSKKGTTKRSLYDQQDDCQNSDERDSPVASPRRSADGAERRRMGHVDSLRLGQGVAMIAKYGATVWFTSSQPCRSGDRYRLTTNPKFKLASSASFT